MLGRVVQRFADATQLARKRGATSVLFHGRAALSDRVFTRLFFEIAAARWQGASEAPEHLAQYLVGLEQCGEPATVLDVGTGAGASAAAAAKRWPSSEVVGVDLSRAMLRRARARHQAPNLSFRWSSADKLPFADDSVDLVTLLHAVAYPPEIHRVVKEGGLVMSASKLFDYQPLGDSDPWTTAGFHAVAHESVAGGHWMLHRKGESRSATS